MPAIPLELPELPRILQGSHGTAASPVLIADPPEGGVPRLLPPVGASHVGHRALAGHGDVFEPFGHLADRSGSDVATDVGFRPDQGTEIQELVGAEVVVLRCAAPMDIHDARAAGSGTDAVPPVVGISEASPRPAEVRDPKLRERSDDVVSRPPRVRDRRPLAHPYPLVHAPSEVLCKMPVHVSGNFVSRPVGIHEQSFHIPAPVVLFQEPFNASLDSFS